MVRAVLDVLFPRQCLACAGSGRPFCSRCTRGLVHLIPPGCRRCGRPFEFSVATCRDCPPQGMTWCRAPFSYEGPVRRAVMRLKFGGQRAVAESLALFMAMAMERGPPEPAPFGKSPMGQQSGLVLSWVPLGRSRRRSRGFDQAETLARALGEVTGLPVRPLLHRVVETAPQAQRGGEERRRALAGAFRPFGACPSRVLLVDDVLTSGATASECARAMMAAGAAEVGVLTAARSLGGPLPARCYRIDAGSGPGSVVARGRSSR